MSLLMMIFAGVIFAGFCVVIYKLATYKQTPALAASQPAGIDILEATLWDVKKGGLVTVVGFGDDYEDVDLIVDQVDRSERRGKVVSRDLRVQYKGRELWLNCEKADGKLIVTVTDPEKSPRLVDLGLDEDALATMDEKQAGTFEWNGSRYHYRCSEERKSFEGDGREGDFHYYWEFESDDRQGFIVMQKWEGEPFFVSASRRLGPEQEIRILRVTG